jgi:hypothetical protein
LGPLPSSALGSQIGFCDQHIERLCVQFDHSVVAKVTLKKVAKFPTKQPEPAAPGLRPSCSVNRAIFILTIGRLTRRIVWAYASASWRHSVSQLGLDNFLVEAFLFSSTMTSASFSPTLSRNVAISLMALANLVKALFPLCSLRANHLSRTRA